jgi:hypothetical protein
VNEAFADLLLWLVRGAAVLGYLLAAALVRRWYTEQTAQMAEAKRERNALGDAIKATNEGWSAAAQAHQQQLFEARLAQAEKLAEFREQVARDYVTRDEHTHALTSIQVHLERFEERMLKALNDQRAK